MKKFLLLLVFLSATIQPLYEQEQISTSSYDGQICVNTTSLDPYKTHYLAHNEWTLVHKDRVLYVQAAMVVTSVIAILSICKNYKNLKIEMQKKQ
jgi:hypothetical protein